MRLMALSDIHQMPSKWKKLVKAAEAEKPDVIAIAGDLFPKDQGILNQLAFMPKLKKYARKIQELEANLVLMMGNDDNQLLVEEMEEGCFEGLWLYVGSGDTFDLHGYEWCGMPYVRDYPFGYKYWVTKDKDDNVDICLRQLGKPCLINDSNDFYDIEDLYSYLEDKESIESRLSQLANEIDDMSRTVWLIHGPPSGYGLDVCASGDMPGSDAVREFIMNQQPMLTIHGHIHESPQVSGKWYARIGETLAIQAGQLGFELDYAMLEIDDGIIDSFHHSKEGQ